MVPVSAVGKADGFTLPQPDSAVVRIARKIVDSEPRFLYSCDTRAAKEFGTIPESTTCNVIQTLACS
jgi:hypothetical protein